MRIILRTVHFRYDDHLINISFCEMERVKVEVQIFKREFHTLIYLN